MTAETTDTQTFDQHDPSVTYYGPHGCDRCGKLIVRSSFQTGGHKFDIPDRYYLYPNTEWTEHVCQPEDMANRPTADACQRCGLPADGPGLAFTDGTICNAPTHAGSVREQSAPLTETTNG